MHIQARHFGEPEPRNPQSRTGPDLQRPGDSWPLDLPASGPDGTPDSNTVDVWRVSLAPSSERLEHLSAVLAPDEWIRVDRYRFVRDRQAFIAARGLLRVLLGRYLDCDPAAVGLHNDQNGKPGLTGDGDAAQISFNVSHSGGLGLIAVAQGTPIGIDLEEVREMSGLDSIAQRFFSAREMKDLALTTDSTCLDAFFRCWTRKEAYLKARGDGLAFPLDRFDVSLLPDQEPRIWAVDGDPSAGQAWRVHHLDPAPGYLGALVTPLQLSRLRRGDGSTIE